MSAAQLVKRHLAGTAHYAGDVRSMLGEIKGPTTYGGRMVATAAIYDDDADRTAVAFSHCKPEDLARAVRADDGAVRLPGTVVGTEAGQ